MRLLFELSLFLIIFSFAVFAGALILWVAGLPFELDPRDSLGISMIGICFVLPGAGNIWIMFRGKEGENVGERLCAGVRGFGMLLCAVAAFFNCLVKATGFRHGIWIFAIGSVFWWGTIPFEDYFSKYRLNSAGLIKKDSEQHNGN